MRTILTFLFIITINLAHSQEYFYLEKIELNGKSDFAKNEENLIKAIDYMAGSTINDDDFDRKACTRFIIRFAEGSPDVTVSLDSYVSKLYKKNLDLLTMFMGFWVKSSIKNKTGTAADHELYSVTEIAKYASAGNGTKINPTLSDLINAHNDGKVAEWLRRVKG